MRLNNTVFLTALSMLAFAANSLLCRLALKSSHIDPASFTAVRLVSGALVLALLVRWRSGRPLAAGNWRSAAALFVYAAAFSVAYSALSAATGALLLFGSVQSAMIGHGIWRGERFRPWQIVGFAVAIAGLLVLLLPGLSAPPLLYAALMIAAGVAWAVYSLRAKGVTDPTRETAGNFLRAALLGAVLSLALLQRAAADSTGIALAIASGALASGLGYAVWYTALQRLQATTAAIVQLSVPVLAAAGGVLLLGEPLSGQLFAAACAVVGGIALVILAPAPVAPDAQAPR